MSQQTPYQMLGEDGIRRLVDIFYDIMDSAPEAEAVRAMHGDDTTEIRSKLADYLNGWPGGPHHYHQKYGTVCLTEPHAHYHIGPQARDQWLWCMEQALQQTGASDALRDLLKQPMFGIADAVRNQDGDQ